MAVKRHELVHDTKSQVDLSLLAQYIQLFNEQPSYLPAPSELVKYCKDVVKCLALAQIPRESDRLAIFLDQLRQVEEFLQSIVRNVAPELRDEIIFAVLKRLYSIISNPQSEACPAASIVLSLMQGDMIRGAVHWLVQEAESFGPSGAAGLRATLGCLYRWLFSWQCTPVLSDWVLAFMKGLEEKKRFDILVEVSLENIDRLFDALLAPTAIRQAVAPVIFHILASMRTTNDALDKIAPKVCLVLESLASDSSPTSRQVLQNLVDITSAMMNQQFGSRKSMRLNAIFKEKYAKIVTCLDTHMASKSNLFLTVEPWKKLETAAALTQVSGKKIGLTNNGNTCYMNSVIQALLLTKQFSSHVMLKMSVLPYWGNMSHIFAMMLYSVQPVLDPSAFYSLVKPPHFTDHQQHDSSEFLGYLLELLHNQENENKLLLDKTAAGCSSKANKTTASGAGLEAHNSEPSCKKERSSSPNVQKSPSGSPNPVNSGKKSPTHYSSAKNNYNGETEMDDPNKSAGSSSSSLKRSLETESAASSLTKRRCTRLAAPEGSQHNTKRESFIQNIFGGVLLTRTKCSGCHSSSLRRDMFRDLQLAFPEKPLQGTYTVQALLEYYCSTERLSGDNRYNCTDCGGLQDAERSVLIESPPKYLILVLKNFRYNPKLQVQTKLMQTVHQDHLITLPVTRSHEQHSVYQLYAAVIHTGTTLDSGHYFTMAKDNDQWFTFNDSVVEPNTEAELNSLGKSSTPYILFYRRTDIEEGARPLIEDLPANVSNAVYAHNKEYVETLQKCYQNNRCETNVAL